MGEHQPPEPSHRGRVIGLSILALLTPLILGYWLTHLAPPLPFVASESPMDAPEVGTFLKGEGRPAEEVGRAYLERVFPSIEGSECRQSISTETEERFGPARVTLILEQTGCQDDSVEGARYRVELQQEDGDQWVILGAFQSQRCWTGRGMPFWHDGVCS